MCNKLIPAPFIRRFATLPCERSLLSAAFELWWDIQWSLSLIYCWVCLRKNCENHSVGLFDASIKNCWLTFWATLCMTSESFPCHHHSVVLYYTVIVNMFIGMKSHLFDCRNMKSDANRSRTCTMYINVESNSTLFMYI